MKVLLLVLVVLFSACKKEGESGGVDGIDKTGVWVPDSPFVKCYTNSNLDTLDYTSDITSGNWTVKVDGNSATEISSDADCTHTYSYRVVVDKDKITASDISVAATNGSCEVTLGFSGLIHVNQTNKTENTGVKNQANVTGSVNNETKFIIRANEVEAGGRVCLYNFKKQ